MTLSHCWGQKTFLVTNKANLKNHPTSIPIYGLSQTFKDAIWITRQLKIKYLRIDSLCIVQDDLENWAFEAKSMSTIYSNSYLNIAASSSGDGNGSCLFPRKEVETITVGTNIRIRREIGKFTNLVDGGVLNSRAWVMQERILSPRNLHGTSAQLFWECGYSSHAEDGSPTRHADNIFHPQQKLNTRGIELMAPDYKYDFYPPNDHSGKWLRTLYQWYALVEYYSGCNLTKQTDIFPAVSVPAQHFSGQIQSRYMTGLWEDYLIHGLCWYLKDCSISTGSIPQPNLPYIAPSWPWASAK